MALTHGVEKLTHSHSNVRKKRKTLHTWKKSRENGLYCMLFPCTFCKKMYFPKCASPALHFTVEIAEKNSPTKQIFREINCLVISLVKTVNKLISRNLSHKSARSREKFCHFHTHSVEKQEIHCNAIFFPSNQFRVNYCWFDGIP